MGTVWFLIAPGDLADRFISGLYGNFAVRAFASWQSFLVLSQFTKGSSPDIILSHLPSIVEGSSLGIDDTDKILERKFPNVHRMYLVPQALTHVLQGPRRFVFSEQVPIGQLLMRINNVLAATACASDEMRYRDIVVDGDNQSLRLAGSTPVALTKKEFMMIKAFLDSPGCCIDRKQFISKVWQGIKVSPRTIDSQVSRLRRRLVDSEVSIESVYGGGYILR